MTRMLTPYDDPHEHQCPGCGFHQGECDGPPARCCEACDHWTPIPLLEERLELGDMTREEEVAA